MGELDLELLLARPVLYDAFRMHDGHTLTGTMEWGTWGSSGGRPAGGTITLAGTYPLTWHDYSIVDGQSFRYLIIGVEPEDVEARAALQPPSRRQT